MSWRDDEDADAEVFVNDRHRRLHYAAVAREIVALLPREDALVLDQGCGEALSADRVAARCATLYLCDASPRMRQGLAARFGDEPKIAVIAPGEVEALPNHGLDLVVTSLAQRLVADELDEWLGLWHAKLKEDGRLVLLGVVPHESGRRDEGTALLRFAWRGGFLTAALFHLARNAFPGEAGPEPALSRYGEAEMIALLRDRNFSGRRVEPGIGQDPKRMTFVATPK